MDELTSIKLTRLLRNLVVDDLKNVSRKLKLKDVRVSGNKGEIISSICASPTLNDPPVLERLTKIGEYFAYGGQDTLTLFKVNVALPAADITRFTALFGEPRSIATVDGTPFRLAKVEKVTFHNTEFFSARYEFPGGLREVDDFDRGTLRYIPAADAECVFRTRNGATILDIRCVAAEADSFAKCITGLVWGKDGNSIPLQSARIIQLSHALTMELYKKFKARSYQIKVSEADEEIQGRFHPSTTEFTTKKWDLTTKRKKLGVSTAAEDMAHGLEFDDKYEGICVKAGCKISLHYPTNQVRFMKTSSFGSYDAVVNAILELSNV